MNTKNMFLIITVLLSAHITIPTNSTSNESTAIPAQPPMMPETPSQSSIIQETPSQSSMIQETPSQRPKNIMQHRSTKGNSTKNRSSMGSATKKSKKGSKAQTMEQPTTAGKKRTPHSAKHHYSPNRITRKKLQQEIIELQQDVAELKAKQ